MKTQKFFNINLIFINQSHSLGRNVIESWLQFFFDTDLKHKELSKFIADKNVKHIEIITINKSHEVNNINWWEDCFAVKRMSN